MYCRLGKTKSCRWNLLCSFVFLVGRLADKRRQLYCLAPKLEQADLAYDAFYQIVQQDEELSEISKKRRSDIYVQEFNLSLIHI